MLDNGNMIKDIAKHFNVSLNTIYNNMKEYNLEKKNRFFIDRDTLHELHVTQDWTAREIAEYYNVDIKVIYNHKDHYKLTKI